MDRVVKVAMPLTAATDAVPDSVPPPGLVVIANVTVLVAPGTVAPPRSWIATRTPPAALMVAPAVVVVGCPGVRNPSLDACASATAGDKTTNSGRSFNRRVGAKKAPPTRDARAFDPMAIPL